MGENWLDKTIGWIAPKWGAERAAYRLQASYNGAIATRLDTSWAPSDRWLGLPALNEWTQRQLRDRSKELERNNVVVSSLLTRSVDNVVGPKGITPQATTDDKEWNKQAEALWAAECDKFDFFGNSWISHQRLVVRSYLRDGDVGSVLLDSGQIQPVEGDFVNNPNRAFLAEQGITDIQNGVRLGNDGRPVSYFIDTKTPKNNIYTSTEVDAKDFVFFKRSERFGQQRGLPVFSACLPLFDQLDKYINAAIVAARMAACIGFAITKENPGNYIANLPAVTTGAEGQTTREIKIEPGMTPILKPGEGIQTLNPAQPGQDFPNTIRMMLRLAGIAIGVPLEITLLDFSVGSYSSCRAALLQAYRTFETIQQLFVGEYLNRIYRWKISKWMNEGKLPERDNAWNVRWITPKWSYLNPVQEALALQIGLDSGVHTLGSILQASGQEFETYLMQRKYELDEMRKAGIPVVHSSSTMQFDFSNTPAPGNETSDPINDEAELEEIE